jgi:adenylate kinase family enzyme
MKNIVIFGAPGSGKGTQSDKMIEKYGLTTTLQAMYSVQRLRKVQS